MEDTSQRNTEEPVIDQPYLIGDVARRTGRHVMKIRRLEAEGKIPKPARDSSGRRFYTRAQVDAIVSYFENDAQPSTKAS